ncbi:histidine kinase [Nonomuraea fuscirosea]|uniref:sensor histidine kinase n=1 Tax=Nonomuraea fuscirosea TaxID=1291556 RepID=UPI002DD7C721|nr:histidine kinase [Nonomuraea fuscirosea]WSA55780.1 histidine kinase [Nonomuraea fuscirosea]
MFLTSADEVRIGGMRPRPGWMVGLAGFVPAFAAAVAVVLGDLAGAPGWHLVADLVGGVVACAGVWLCRRWPVSAGLMVIAVSVPAASASVAAGIAALLAALYRRPRVAIMMGVAGVVATLVRFAVRPPGLAPYPVWALVGVLFGAAVTAWGMLARTRRELLLSLAERARRAEAEQRLRAEEARRAERLGIAREMHDVLAHRLSLLAVHAGALEFNPDATAGEVAETAGVIRFSARLALEELRAVISVLRDPGSSSDAGAPMDQGKDLGALVEESRRAGMRVELRAHGVRLSEAPDVVGRAAYRIVQEGLTNARKHAPGQPVTVVVGGAGEGELVVEVRNPLPGGPAALTGNGRGTEPEPAGSGALGESGARPGPAGSGATADSGVGSGSAEAAPAGTGSAGLSGSEAETSPAGLSGSGAGTGLVGLAERATLAGGRLECGETADGEFRLAARLPWPR